MRFLFSSISSGGFKGQGRERRTPLTSASKLFQFHAVFGRIGKIVCLPPPPMDCSRPHLGKILDASLISAHPLWTASGRKSAYGVLITAVADPCPPWSCKN